MNVDDLRVHDSFKQLFDIPGWAILHELSQRPLDLTHIKKSFISAFVYSLPVISEKAIKLRDDKVDKVFLQTERMWNVFTSNPTALSLGSNLLSALTSVGDAENGNNIHPRQFVASAVSRSIAFLSMVMQNQVNNYETLITPRTIEESDFDNFVDTMDAFLSSDVGGVARGVDNIIEALMFLRERSVEEVPLTIDIGLGIYGLWESLPIVADNGSEGYRKRIRDIRDLNNVLDDIGKLPIDKLLNEVEEAAKHFGRGVATLKLSKKTNEGLHIVEDKIWQTHKNAPLSTLYGFNWMPPSSGSLTEMNTRIVLLPSRTISIQSSGEPLLEYFAGGWKYVDPYHKAKTISRVLHSKYHGLPISLEENEPWNPIYRIARLAYQLSYHNHGATIELSFSDPKFARYGKLKKTMDLRNDIKKSKTYWRKIEIQDETVDDGEHQIGRWVYQLSTSDGITTLHADQSQNLYLGDFGQIVKFDTKKCDKAWYDLLRNEIGDLDSIPNLGGARHHSAFQIAIEDTSSSDISKIVFCISQDGYIDIYTREDWMKLR